MPVLSPEPAVRAWMVAAAPALGGRVSPHDAVEDETPPYAAYLRVNRRPDTHQQGQSGTHVLLLRVDVWDDRYLRGRAAADALAAAAVSVGPGGLRGVRTNPVTGEDFPVTAVRCVGDVEASEADDADAERTWHRVMLTFLIAFRETA